MNVKKGLSNVIILLIVVYFIGCYGEILVKNTKPNPSYSNLNVITKIITNLSDK